MAAYSIFIGKDEVTSFIWDYFRDFLLPEQLLDNGSFPEEEGRTLSLFYSVFNLDALTYICRLAEMQGEDLWNFRTGSGVGIKNAIKYLTPFILQPAKWPGKQIKPFTTQGPVYLAFAGLAGKETELLNIYLEYRRSLFESEDLSFMDPFIILVDMIVINTVDK